MPEDTSPVFRVPGLCGPSCQARQEDRGRRGESKLKEQWPGLPRAPAGPTQSLAAKPPGQEEKLPVGERPAEAGCPRSKEAIESGSRAPK